MRSLPKNWRAKLLALGCSREDIRRATVLVRLARGEDGASLRDIREDYCFEVFDVCRKLKKYREQDATDPEVHTRAKPKKEDWRVSIGFAVHGIWGRETYLVNERDANAALSRAWTHLHWDALDLGLVAIGDKSIARTAEVHRVSP